MRKKAIAHILADVWFDEETGILEERYKVATEYASEDQWKEYQLIKMEFIHAKQPAFFLCDMRKLLFAMSTELHEWTSATVIEALNQTKLKRKPFLVSTDTLTNMSVEMVMGEDDRAYAYRFFNDEKEAREWMLQN